MHPTTLAFLVVVILYAGVPPVSSVTICSGNGTHVSTCSSGKFCCHDGGCCDHGYECCGDFCCHAFFDCCNGKCVFTGSCLVTCPVNETHVATCPSGKFCCHDGGCCDHGYECCGDYCCGAFSNCCNGRCTLGSCNGSQRVTAGFPLAGLLTVAAGLAMWVKKVIA